MNCENENATVSGETYVEDDEDIVHGINEFLVSPISNTWHTLSIGHQSNANVGDKIDLPANKANKSKINSILFDNRHNLRLAHGKKYEDLVNRSLERLRRDPGSYNKGIKKISAFQKQAIKPNSIKFQNEGGMIKKITITNNKSAQSTPENRMNLNTKIVKVKEPMPSASSDDKLAKQQRANTSFSREYKALQKSVIESKVLTEFVTDASVVKSRKLRKKQLVMPTTPTSSDHSYSSTDLANKKRQRNKHNAPNVRDTGLGGRSHSPNMYNNYSDNSNSNSEHKKRCKSLQKYDSDSSVHSTLNKWPSDEILISGLGNMKRTNMRSENSDFVQRQKEFLQQVKISTQNTPTHRRSRSASLGLDPLGDGVNAVVGNSNEQKTARTKERTSKRLQGEFEAAEEDDQPLLTSTNETLDGVSVNTSSNSVSAANTSGEADVNSMELLMKNDWHPPRIGSDNYCWKCHASKVNLSCLKCLRSYHSVCAKAKVDDMANMWICPECITLDNMLNSTKRSRHNELSLDLLSQLLSFAIKRIRFAKGHYSFRMPYEEYNSLKRIIVYPVTFDSLQAKVEAKEYRCVDEFLNDMKWMLHNAHILACGSNTKVISDTKAIMKICRQEANEIETCAECYLNANTRSDWFVDVCSQPHLLLWAKLKGFPYWPAKAMGLGPPALVKVKFFGEHDRAFVPIKDCYLYSTQDPNTQTGKRAARELADCIKEVGHHIERIVAKVGDFCYAPFKTPYDPNDEVRQLENMMPGVQEFIKRQQGAVTKPSLQFKIYKTADNNMSIIQKDLSTGEISSGQSQENEDFAVGSSGSQKKKKGFTPPPLVGVQDKNGEAVVSKPPPKYEVVLKVSSDDSNSSKLTPVILKRKSNNGGDAKRAFEEEVHTLKCMPKLTRMEEKIQELNTSNHSLKRKIDSAALEKPKAKHSKPQEMKIPIVSIKRLTAQKDDNVPDTNKNFKLRRNSNPNLQLDKLGDSQMAVEESNKPCVMLKKFPKSHTPSSSPSVPLSAATVSSGFVVPPPVQALQSPAETSLANKFKDNIVNPTTQPLHAKQNASNAAVKDKTDEQNKRDVVKNIWKDLKPFIEVKKEVLSDNEQVEEREQPQKNDKTNPKPKVGEKPELTSNLNIVTQKNNNEKVTPKNGSCNEITNDNLLTHVKKEILSDDDNDIDDNAPLLPEPNQIKSSGQANTVANNNKGPTEYRLVGETLIQKVSSKNNVNQQQVCTSSSQTHKRNTLKGIPYGPLPASALPKTKIQNDNAAINARAKKSFPMPSPPMEVLAAKTTLNVPNSMATNCATTTNQNVATNRRPLSRTTTMVAIPVDYGGANPNQNSSGMASIVSSIPVPPLMAVSKMISPGNANNSMANTNNTSTVTMTGLSGILPTSTVVTYNPLTTITAAVSVATSMINSSSQSFSPPSCSFTIAARKSPLTSALTTTTTSLSSTTVAVTARKSPITTFSLNNRSNLLTAAGPSTAQNPKPLIMSTPPPLAGLSGTVFNNPIVPNVTTATEVIFTPPILTTSTNAAGSSRRGPPKLVSRPRGPLQSEGQTTYSTQAGPVSKVFIENAHKITDYFISVMEDTMSEIAQGNEASLQARVVLLEKELERTKQTSEQQMAELRRNNELMRMNMENEKTRLLIETRKQCEAERIRAIEETKRKQWCAQCRQEANFYCCWNASYCGYTCQQLHWGKHTVNCAQTGPTPVEMSSGSSNTTVASSSSIMPPEQRHLINTTNSSSSIMPSEQRHQINTTNSSSSIMPPEQRHQINTTNSSSSIMPPEQRHQINTTNSNSRSILNSSITSNNKSTISSLSITHTKKEKALAKHALSSNMLSSSSSSAASTSLSAAAHSNNSQSTEVLQLPTNTYMTPVSRAPVSAQTLRCNTTNSMPVVQRFVSVPTTHVNASGGPHTISTVRQSNGWARTIHIPTNNPRNATVAAPIVNVPTADRSGNVKPQIRYI